MKFLTGTVYSKALAVFLAASLLLLGTVAALTQLIILREFNLTEERDVRTVLQRLSAVMARETRPLEAFVSELSRSPSVGPLLSNQRPNAHWEKITPEILMGRNVDFVLLYGVKGEMVSAVFCDEAVRERLQGGELVGKALANFSAKTWEPIGTSGYILINEQLCSLTVFPVAAVPSDTGGGLLVGGKLIDKNTWGFLEGLFSATIKFHPFKNTSVNETGGRDMTDLLNSQETVVETADGSQITGYRLIKAIDGSPLGYINISQPRPLRQQALRAIQIFLSGICLGGGSLVMVVWLLLDRTILARIKDLTGKLDKEKRSGRLPVRLDFKGEDELGVLARSIEDLAGLLERAQSQYRAVVEDQTEMICRFDADLRIAFANKVFNQMFDLEDRAFANHDLGQILPPKTFEDISTRFHQLSQDAELMSYTHDMSLAGGKEYWLRCTLRRNFASGGECLGGQWVASDITAQIEAQKKTMETERRFRRLFETASDGILLVGDENLVISDINPSLCRMLMLAGSEVLGKSLEQQPVFSPCLDVVNFFRRFELDAHRPSFRNECRLERADGSALFIELRCSKYAVGGNQFIQINFRNISERVLGERELRKLSAKLLRLQDEERRRIARELHDSTAQNLSALEMNISLIEPFLDKSSSKALQLVAETRQIASECSRELRNISYLLHPPLIDEVGLSFAVKWFADGFAKRTGIGATVEIEEGFPRLDADVEMPLFRIVQEAMTNVYRHSGADHAWISLCSEGRFVNLEIKDNGHGFAVGDMAGEEEADCGQDVRPGVGLAGMRERIANLGGKLDIENSPLGVTINVRLTIDHLHVNASS